MFWPTPPGRVRDLTLLLAVLLAGSARAEKPVVATIAPEDLVEYATEPEAVRRLIEASLELTRKKIGYRFGSNSPEKGGMDCSGAVQAALSRCGLKDLPRSSSDFHEWVRKEGSLVPTPGVDSTADPVFAALRPGDLLFWTGTYDTGNRESGISHVKIYLGTLRSDGRGVVFGASDGRRYRGKRINGVSVFDWEVPGKDSKSEFVGFGPVPGFRPEGEGAAKTGAHVLNSLLENLFKKSEVSPP